MCDPLSATVVATGLAGSAWATHNQSKSANRNLQARQTAKENAYRSGMDRQDGYASDAQSAFRPVVESMGGEGFKSQLAENTAKRLQAFGGAESDSSDFAVPGSTDKNVAMAMEKAFGEKDDETSRNRRGLARIGGYGDTSFNQGLDRSSFTRAFGNLSDKALRDSNLINADMIQADNNARKAPSTSLTLAKTAGQMLAQYGAAGTPGMGTATAARPERGAFGNIGPQPSQFQIGGYAPF